MGRYLALIYGDENQWAAADEGWNIENARRHRVFIQTAGAAIIIGGELLPSAQAVSIRLDTASRQCESSGPFVDTPVAIGGFYVLEADSMVAALTLSRTLPEASAPGSGVEIRPLA